MNKDERFTDVWCSETGHIGITDKGIDKVFTGSKFKEFLNELSEENEQLKQRNQRQTKRLAELYELMAKKDWESLTEIIDDFCSCEEQLQRESGTYGGLE